jgi:hypothetical protein
MRLTRHVWRNAARLSSGIQSSLESLSAAASEQPMDILQTTNPTWGFHGAFSHHATDPSAAWPLVRQAIAKATGCPAKCVKTFLDSSQGRVFADGVSAVRLLKIPAGKRRCAVLRSIERFMRARQGRRDFRAEYRAERERNASLRVSHDRLLAAAKYIARCY